MLNGNVPEALKASLMLDVVSEIKNDAFRLVREFSFVTCKT